jgi:hypothetical protein
MEAELSGPSNEPLWTEIGTAEAPKGQSVLHDSILSDEEYFHIA